MSDYCPIETAPKDREILCWWPISGGEWVSSYWDKDEHASKPKPHWYAYGMSFHGKSTLRRHQPTHWREKLPPPERETLSGEGAPAEN